MQLREAAETLGVHYQTAYGWVREGVLPGPQGGPRLRGQRRGRPRARGPAGPGRASPPGTIQVRDWPAQAGRLYAAIADGEETQARHGLDRLAGGVPLVDLCQRVIGPALRRIGDDWAAGRVSIAQEHRASAICERLIAVHAQQPPGRPRGIAVVTTPPGERHGLPALMAAACLREDRWLVHHLAADLPVAEVAGLASQVGAGLVVLSSATTDRGPPARGAATRSPPPPGVPCWPAGPETACTTCARWQAGDGHPRRTRHPANDKRKEPPHGQLRTPPSARAARRRTRSPTWPPSATRRTGIPACSTPSSRRRAGRGRHPVPPVVPFLGRRLTLVYQVTG